MGEGVLFLNNNTLVPSNDKSMDMQGIQGSFSNETLNRYFQGRVNQLRELSRHKFHNLITLFLQLQVRKDRNIGLLEGHDYFSLFLYLI